MRRRIMTVAMATFFSGMMAFSDVEIFADQDITSDITTEIETTTETVTTEHKKPTTASTAEHKKVATTEKRKQTKKKTAVNHKEKINLKKKSLKKTEIHSQKLIRKDQKNKKEYLGKYLYFNQTDAIWNNNNLSIHSSGCGPSAVAVCISNLTHKFVTPVDTAKWAKQEGYYYSSGSLHSAIPAMANHWNLECRGIYRNSKQIENALRSGHMVVGLMGPGYFTKKGHFITLLGIDKIGKVEVADVASRARSQKTYDLDFIIQNSKLADAGGPFWEIWNARATKSNRRNKSQKKKIAEKQIIQNTGQQKDEIIRKFYLSLQAELTDFEKEIPMEELLLGIKDQTVQIHKSKINIHLKQLGEQLNDEKLITISQSYSFGMDAMQLHKEKTYFAVPKYLENMTRFN